MTIKSKLSAAQNALASPESFWGEAARDIDWNKTWDKVLDESEAPFYRWFFGASLNTCYNAVDRHVENGRADQDALIFDSAMTGEKRRYTYAELLEQVSKTAGMISNMGVGKGDRVVIYMPMIPETVFAMLACARIGAVHSVVFGGFASKELATRIDDAKPKLILTASCGLEPARIVEYMPLLDDALDIAFHKDVKTLVFQRAEARAHCTEGRDYDWEDEFQRAAPVACAEIAATDPLYILYTSGTTGVPKGVVRDNGGHAVALNLSMAHVYDAAPGDVYWAASDVGWVVGHSYIVYAPLIRGCTTLLYEGKPVGTPDANAFWRVIEEYGVNIMFTAPTAIRAIKREDPQGSGLKDFDLSKLRSLFLAGERADPDTVKWAQNHLKIPVIDHWWQTELGWPALATCLGRGENETRIGSAGRPVSGFNVCVLREDHQPCDANETGDIVIKLPLPPGCLPTLWNNDDGYKSSYLSDHPGYYSTGDAGFIDEDGFVHVMSRTDDLINVAGHRLSTGGIEQIINDHADVAECAVFGAADALKGSVPVGLMVLNAGVDRPAEEICGEVIARVRQELGPVAAFKRVAVISALPKTRSGKILRGTIRKIADGDPYTIPATIENEAVLDLVQNTLSQIGYAAAKEEMCK